MTRRRRSRDAEVRRDPDTRGDSTSSLQAWGLEPAQWRPVGRLSLVRDRARLLWRARDTDAADLALRTRRAYDRLGELGVTVAADATERGIEIELPLDRVEIALRILADRSLLPDALLVGGPPADRLRALRREIGAYRRDVELIIGDGGGPDPIAELRARVRTMS